MVKVYKIDNAGGQASSNFAIIIACNLPGDYQSEVGLTEEIPPIVLEAAQQYFNLDPQNAGSDTIPPSKLPDKEIKSMIEGAAAILCAFDVCTKALMDQVKSTGPYTTGICRSEGSLADHDLLVRILEAEVWTCLADNIDLDVNTVHNIEIFSGQTYMPLSRFENGVKRIVNADILRPTDGIAQIKETVFWKRIMKFASSSTSTSTSTESESDPTNILGGQQSTLNTPRSYFHTYPSHRRGSRRTHSRVRSVLNPDMYKPRTTSNIVPTDTDTFDRNCGFGFDGSETSPSDSAGEGNHGS